MTCRTKIDKSSVLFFVIVGLLFIALTVFLLFVDDTLYDDPSPAFYIFTFGLVCILIGLRTLAVNKKACIHADEDGIEASISYWLFLGRVSCKYSEIISAKLYGDTLVVRCVETKKSFQMNDLDNSDELYRYIRRRIPYQRPKASIEDLKTTVANLGSQRKTALKKFAVIIILFVATLAAVIVSDGSNHVSGFDWPLALSIVSFVAMTVLLCVKTIRVARISGMFLKTREELIQCVIRDTPPQPGDVVAVYINDQNDPFRCVVYRTPDSEEKHLVFECVNENYEIEKIAEPSVYLEEDGDLNWGDDFLKIEDMIEIPIPKIN
ncbi:MAG: hypothetical protein K6D56_01395 [Clostridia bacterium]|nr:hypothetical protein [Clostridia bacterium]